MIDLTHALLDLGVTVGAESTEVSELVKSALQVDLSCRWISKVPPNEAKALHEALECLGIEF